MNKKQNILKNIKNDLSDVIIDPISDKIFDKYFDNCKIILYSDLVNYDSILDILTNDFDFCVILFKQNDKGNNHWLCLTRQNNIINHFCSYGSMVDEYFKWSIQSELNKVHEYKPYLSILLNKYNDGPIYYNCIDYQNDRNLNIATCGRWCIVYIMFSVVNHHYNLNQFYNYMKRQKKKYKLPFDKLISIIINDL
jgi:hypothetical protein